MAATKLLSWGAASASVGTVAVLYQNNWDIGSIGVVRFGRAVYSVGRIVADYKITFSKLDESAPEYKQVRSKVHKRSAERLLDLCCTNGGVFIKVGQHLAALDYLLPVEYTSTLKVLHNKAPRVPLDDIHRVIREDLKLSSDELFQSFDEEPLGVASIAQVHSARLTDGTKVAVKVQHRKVRAHSFIDMKTMEVLANWVSWTFPEFNFLWIAKELKINCPLELDFLHEARNMEKVRGIFKHIKWLKIPKVYWNLSSDRVLVMEFCEGGHVDNMKYITENNIEPMTISRQLGELYSEMIFVKGFVHCDPHPGNLLVRKVGKTTEIILLDHGLYTTLSDSFRLRYCNLWLSVLNADVDGIHKYSKQLGCGPLFNLLACILTNRTWSAVSTGIDKVQQDEDEINEIHEVVSFFFVEISEVLASVPREMLLILKTNDLLRSLERSLGTKQRNPALLSMSSSCVRATYDNRRKACTSVLGHSYYSMANAVMQFKLEVYSGYLWLRSTTVGNMTKKLFVGA